MGILSKNIYLPLVADTEGDANLIRDQGNASVFTAGLADIGGSGHSYSGGFFYPSGNQDGWEYDNANLLDVVELAPRVGGILVQMNLELASVGSSTEALVFCGNSASPEGGWGVLINAAQVRVAYKETGGSTIIPVTLDAPAEAFAVSIYIDVSHPDGYGQIYSFVEGLMSAFTDDLPTPFPQQKASRMFSLFNQRTNDAGAVNQQLNAGAGSVGVNHLRIVSFEYDAFHIAYSAAKEYHADPAALPPSLVGA